ncbi:MAG: triose-phosphate isomerase [Anaerolineae bacterium]|nr:triose-phosphate isomerase [Anaerolineae bacterium]
MTYDDSLEDIVTRRIIMAGNWKMYKTVGESLALVRALKESLAGVSDREIVVCPPFTALHAVAEALRGGNIQVGAQNLYPAEEGAYTGEVSPRMLLDVGCQFVILGHSERRQYFQEGDAFINEKLKAALEYGLKPILCVGETLEQREQGRQRSVVSAQVGRDLEGVSAEAVKQVAIAYEPIWAIGTGHTATPQQANEMHRAIREVLNGLYGGEIAQGTSILYGGSVKPGNVDELMAEPDVDGTLVGGASLEAESFIRIVSFQT